MAIRSAGPHRGCWASAAAKRSASPAAVSTTERARRQDRSRRGATAWSTRTIAPVAVEPQEVEREAHPDRVDRAAGHDQERVVGRQRVEPREPAAARAAIGGDEQDEVAGQRAALEPRQPRGGPQRWFAVVGERRTRAPVQIEARAPWTGVGSRQLRGTSIPRPEELAPALWSICGGFATRSLSRRVRQGFTLASSGHATGVKQVDRAVDGRGVARHRDICSTHALPCPS